MFFNAVSGGCFVIGNCIHSPNYPANYPHRASCQIKTVVPMTLDVQLWSLEGGNYDTVRLKPYGASSEQVYGGASGGPQGVTQFQRHVR